MHSIYIGSFILLSLILIGILPIMISDVIHTYRNKIWGSFVVVSVIDAVLLFLIGFTLSVSYSGF